MMDKEDIKNLKELLDFLDADMPSKIFPDEKIKNEIWTREDKFENIKEIREYLKQHFLIAFPKLNKDELYN